MSLNRWLDQVLPWRRRRQADIINEQGEDLRLREAEEELITITNGHSVSGGIRYGPKNRNNFGDNSYFNQPGSAGVGFNLLSMIMCSEEFERGDQTCVQLIKFIYQGNVEGLSKYLDSYTKEEVDSIAISGQRLLHILCFRKDVDSLRLVLALGANVNHLNSDGVSPLHLAVSEGWTEGVEVLLENGARANTVPKVMKPSNWPYHEIPILTAARNGDVAIASALMEEEPNLRLTDADRNTILHLACCSQCNELVEILLENKLVASEISSSNNKGNSPLHMLMTGDEAPAAEEEILGCVQLLLQKGANINHLNAAKETPLFLAARENLPSVVKVLLESGADPKRRSIDGKTVLHAACRSGSHESLSLLLKSGRVSHLLLVEDHAGFAPFHIAVSSCSINCCEILLRHGDHLTIRDSMGRSRCSLVLKNMPSAFQLLKRTFDANIEISDKDPDDPEFRIKMDFSVLLSKTTEDVEASLISDLSNSESDSLLKHPLVESFLYLKWHKIRAFFYSYVFLYFLFLIVHTFYIVKTFDMNTDWDKEKHILRVVHVAHIIMVLLLLIPGTITIFANIRKYFKQWETYCKIIALTTAAFVVFSQETTFKNPDVMKNVAAVSIFFTWVEFMMLLGRFPSLGIYILMFTRVAKSIIRFLLAFSSLLIAFTLAFGILFSKIEVFKSFPTGFVRTLMMMIGEIEYGEIYEQTKSESTATMIISHIFLVVFLFLIPVLMANLLIGLAVNDLPDLQLHSKIRRLVKEASYLGSYERLLLVFKEWPIVPSSIMNLFSGRGSIKREIIIYPNQQKHMHTSVPSDAVKEAIANGIKARNEQHGEDLDKSFKKFFREYSYDRERLDNVENTLLNIAATLNVNSGCDAVDGKFKSKRIKKTIKSEM